MSHDNDNGGEKLVGDQEVGGRNGFANSRASFLFLVILLETKSQYKKHWLPWFKKKKKSYAFRSSLFWEIIMNGVNNE